MVGLCVDVLWMVVWLSVRTVGTVCKVEGDFSGSVLDRLLITF